MSDKDEKGQQQQQQQPEESGWVPSWVTVAVVAVVVLIVTLIVFGIFRSREAAASPAEPKTATATGGDELEKLPPETRLLVLERTRELERKLLELEAAKRAEKELFEELHKKALERVSVALARGETEMLRRELHRELERLKASQQAGHRATTADPCAGLLGYYMRVCEDMEAGR